MSFFAPLHLGGMWVAQKDNIALGKVDENWR